MIKPVAYIKLMRFDKPIGTFLLWAPTAWALWCANKGMPSIHLLIIFLLGTITARAAGCVINDITDRNIDGHVSRTKLRPIASGEIGLKQAIFIFILLIAIALYIVLQLPISCFYLACLALIIMIVYPFCKRFFVAPQLVLGVAFSLGIPMAYLASGVSVDKTTWLLMILNFLWIVAYDTLYAMSDKKDDLRIGVLSTAILFGDNSRLIVTILQIVLHFIWLHIAEDMHLKAYFYIFWLIGAANLVYQQKLILKNNEKSYLQGFLINGWYGLILWCGLMLSF